MAHAFLILDSLDNVLKTKWPVWMLEARDIPSPDYSCMLITSVERCKRPGRLLAFGKSEILATLLGLSHAASSKVHARVLQSWLRKICLVWLFFAAATSAGMTSVREGMQNRVR